jgi:D-serine deaminase-like pyridoxal phosphate-dependent protein
MDYHFRGEETVDSPALVYYRDLIEENTGKAIALAGGPDRLWPHVKTHKMAALVRMQMNRGISRFKCATVAEAETCAREGAPNVLLAYPLVGPALGRFIRLRTQYRRTVFWAIGDDLGQLELLGKAAADETLPPPDLLVDVNLGMDRTGVSLEGLENFCLAAAKVRGIRLRGVHCYDGHLGITDLSSRKGAVEKVLERLRAVKGSLEKKGLELPVLVMGGTPTFPCHRETPEVYLSPGTLFVHDHGYQTKYPDLDFTPGAAVLSRVVSRPGPGLFTLDTGYKAIASDHADRGVIADLPQARAVAQSEEHWVWRLEDGEPPPIGTVLYLLPTHICPTTALYPGARVVSSGELVNYWEVSARDRLLRGITT